MKEKKPDSVAHELHDCPVPPVKGAITEPEDVLLWPERPKGNRPTSTLDDTMILDTWL